MSIRPATEADEDALAQICLLTGNQGTDATGKFCDERVLSDVYALPYLYAPSGFAWVWEGGDGVAGYVVGTSDTRAFQQWFSDQWWPPRRAGREPRTDGDAWLLPAADDPARMLNRHVDEYPAHLHIDLLPHVQGQGVGRQLIAAAADVWEEWGVPGVHLEASQANTGAQAFYPRVGFTELGRDTRTVTWGIRLPRQG
jgi:GNAT superfamily N-acetyltransferase